MRIGIDSSSTSSISSVDEEAGPSVTPVRNILFPQRLTSEPLTPTPKADRQRPAFIHAYSSSTSLLEEGTPEARRTTHLERANQARRISQTIRSQSEGRQNSPAWLRRLPGSSSKIGAATPSDDSSSGSSFDSKESDLDSEEDLWPVASGRVGSVRREELLRQRQALLEAQEVSHRIRLSGENDIIPNNRAMLPRRFRVKANVIDRAVSLEAKEEAKAEFDHVQQLLQNLQIKKEEEEAKERTLFKAREKELWDRIEAEIKKENEVREKAAQEERERIQKAKEQRQAEEKRAREIKEAEEARIQREKEEQERIKKEEEKQRLAEIKEEEERLRREEQEEKAKSAGGVGISLDREARDQFDHWWSKMNHIKSEVLPVISKNPEWRKQCFTAKRSITRGVSQLTNSRAEISRITQSIANVLAQAKDAASTGEIYTWILNHLSKCLIRQAEQEVASKQDTAFPLARVVVWLLLLGHEEFGNVLMARLTKKCCWCLPYCPGKKAGQDDASYSKLLGKASLDEATFAYTTRMTGIIAFYFAICQTIPTTPPGLSTVDVKLVPEYFRIKALWVWQARGMSSRVLDQSLSPALWSALVEVAGPVLLSTYGRQVTKVWKLMLLGGLGQEKAAFCRNQAANSAKMRLKQLLEDWAKSGRVEGATGGREMEA